EDGDGKDPALQVARALMLGGKTLVDAHVHLARLPPLKPGWERWVMARRVDVDPAQLYDEDGSPIPDRFAGLLDREGVDCAILLAEYSPRVTGVQPIEDIVAVARFDPTRIRVAANVNPHLHHPVAAELTPQLALRGVAL